MGELEIRNRLETRLGRRLADRQWSYLKADGYVDDLISGRVELEDVVEYVRRRDAWATGQAGADLREPRQDLVPAQREARSGAGKALIGDRQMALSALYGAEAAADRWVVAFRRDYLGDELIAYDEVEDWIKAAAEEEGSSKWFNVPLPKGTSAEHQGLGVLKLDPPLVVEEHRGAASQRLLSYGVPDDRWVRRVPVAAHGVLEQLRQLGEYLSRAYLWEEGIATVFVLTGLTPLIPAVRSRVTLASRRPLSRITLTVDPAVTPDELRDRYRKVRKRLVGNHRYRPQTLKAAQLAMFYADVDQESTWAERMRDWNTGPGVSEDAWRYDDPVRFSQECRAAVRTLLEPSFISGDPRGMWEA